MADWKVPPNYFLVEDAGFNTATSSPKTSITTGNVWQEAVASTAETIHLIELQITTITGSYSTTRTVDLARGGAGNEEVIIGGLVYYGKSSANGVPDVFRLPVSIPAGTRLSVRCSSSGDANYAMRLYSAGYAATPPNGDYSTISSAVAVDPGGTANTKGAWVELVASTSETYKGLYLKSGFNNGNTNSDNLVDIAVGGAGSEEVIAQNLYVEGFSSENVPSALTVDVTIPEGSRVSMRAQCSIIDASDRIQTVTTYGWT